MKVQWLKLALLDLKHVGEFIRQENPAAAEKVGGRIAGIIGHLASHPELGKEGRRPGTRELILPDVPYRIIYRVRGDAVQILRIYHIKRKWPHTH